MIEIVAAWPWFFDTVLYTNIPLPDQLGHCLPSKASDHTRYWSKVKYFAERGSTLRLPSFLSSSNQVAFLLSPAQFCQLLSLDALQAFLIMELRSVDISGADVFVPSQVGVGT